MSKTHAHTVYKLKDGKTRVPGVTTIVGLLDKSGPLMGWAWKLGMAGQDYRKVRDKAADAGTLTHYLIECDSKGVEPDKAYTDEFSKDNMDKAETGFLAYLEWKKHNIDKILYSEYRGVHEDLKYGGTVDCIAKLKSGKVALIDFKTGNVYKETSIQIAAYCELSLLSIDERMILQINKDEGSFIVHQLGNLDKCFEIFKHLLAVYYLRKEIK